MEGYNKQSLQPWSYVYGSNTANAANNKVGLNNYAGPGSFQSINGKMYFFPGNTPSAIPDWNSPRYPMLWAYDQDGTPYQYDNAGHKSYQQQGYNAMDNVNAPHHPARMLKGMSKGQMSSLPVHFHDLRLNTQGDQPPPMYSYGQAPDKELSLPKPVEYPSAYNARRYEYPTTTGKLSVGQFENALPLNEEVTQVSNNMFAQSPQYSSQLMPQHAYPVYQDYNTGVPPPIQYQNHPADYIEPPRIPEVMEEQYVYRQVPKVEVVEVPQEIVRYVPKIETKVVEQVVEVPGPVKIPIARPYYVDTHVVVPKYEDRNIPLIVSQNVVPMIHQVDDIVHVEVVKYEPEVVPVDVYVPRPVAIPIKATGEVEQAEVPNALVTKEQLQIAMDDINPHLHDVENYNAIQLETYDSLVQQSQSTAKIHGLTAPDPISQSLYALENEEASEDKVIEQGDDEIVEESDPVGTLETDKSSDPVLEN